MPRDYDDEPPPARGYSPDRGRGGGGSRDGGRGGPPPRRGREERTSLLVRNIPRDTRPEELRSAFERYGAVKDVYLPRDYYTGEPRGFGFVQFLSTDEAEDAQYEMDRTMFLGREVTVVFAEENRKKPDEMRIRERGERGGGPSYSRRRSPPRRRSRTPEYSPSPPRRRSPSPRRRRSPPPGDDDYYDAPRGGSRGKDGPPPDYDDRPPPRAPPPRGDSPPPRGAPPRRAHEDDEY